MDFDRFTKLQLILLMVLVSFIMAQNLPGIKSQIDTTQSELQLKNPFLNNPHWLSNASSSAFLQLWVWEHRRDIGAQFVVKNPSDTLRQIVKLPPLKRLREYALTPGIENFDFREQPFYQPENVQEYLNLQMGRYKYVPTAPLAVLAGITSLVKKYLSLLFEKERVLFRDLYLNKDEIDMMFVLWQYPRLSAQEWYRRYVQKKFNSGITFIIFRKRIDWLMQKHLIKPVAGSGSNIRFSPTVDRQILIIILKGYLDTLDAVSNPTRFKSLREMVNRLENPPLWGSE